MPLSYELPVTSDSCVFHYSADVLLTMPSSRSLSLNHFFCFFLHYVRVLHRHGSACALSSAALFSQEYLSWCVFLSLFVRHRHLIFYPFNLFSSTTFLELLTYPVLFFFLLFIVRVSHPYNTTTPDVRFYQHFLSTRVYIF